MALYADPHRIDSPDYRPPGERSADPDGGQHIPMTIEGVSAARAAAEAAQARRAEGSVTTNDAVVHEVYKLALAVRSAQESWNRNVESERESKRLDPEMAISESKRFRDSDAAASLAVAGQTVDAWLDTKRAAAQQVLEGLSTYDEAGGEQRDRAWARTKLRIDRAQDDPSGKSTVQVARDAIATARPEELPVLIEEVGPYLETLGLPTSFVNAEVAAKVPEYAAAQRDLQNATRDATVVKQDIAAVQRGIEKGIPVVEQVLVDPAEVASRIGDTGA
jgi:hypothetical protein